MFTKFKKISVLLLLTVIVCAPLFVFAQDITSQVKLENPLKAEYGSLSGLIFGAINIALKFAYVFIALSIIWSGFKLITARGKEKELTDAKRSITWTLIGAAIVIGANVIAEVLKNTINSFVTP